LSATYTACVSASVRLCNQRYCIDTDSALPVLLALADGSITATKMSVGAAPAATLLLFISAMLLNYHYTPLHTLCIHTCCTTHCTQTHRSQHAAAADAAASNSNPFALPLPPRLLEAVLDRLHSVVRTLIGVGDSPTSTGSVACSVLQTSTTKSRDLSYLLRAVLGLATGNDQLPDILTRCER
jgi:hypothetical protein